MDSDELKFLAGKVADGTASEQELLLYNTYLDQLETQRTNDALSAVEKERLKRKLKNRIDAHINTIKIDADSLARSKRRSSLKLIRLVAAVTLVLSSFAVLYWYMGRNQEKETVVNQSLLTTIKPGGNKAMLTLADGSQIALEAADNGTIALQGKTKIIKTKDGQLLYEKSSEHSVTSTPTVNTVSTPRGGQYQLMLPDGSYVWLNAASSITYSTDFSHENRIVFVSGEAYFEIAPDKKRPFIVNTAKQSVEVLGTHFNIAAYPDDERCQTTLLTGSVRVNNNSTTARQNKQVVILKPGEQSTVTSDGIVVRTVDLEEIIAWKEGFFRFRGNLEDIMAQIGRWYDVTIDYDKKIAQPLAFGGKISRDRSIEEVLKMIEETGHVRFKIEGRRVMVQY